MVSSVNFKRFFAPVSALHQRDLSRHKKDCYKIKLMDDLVVNLNYSLRSIKLRSITVLGSRTMIFG
jgi:hypothetical protein